MILGFLPLLQTAHNHCPRSIIRKLKQQIPTIQSGYLQSDLNINHPPLDRLSSPSSAKPMVMSDTPKPPPSPSEFPLIMPFLSLQFYVSEHTKADWAPTRFNTAAQPGTKHGIRVVRIAATGPAICRWANKLWSRRSLGLQPQIIIPFPHSWPYGCVVLRFFDITLGVFWLYPFTAIRHESGSFPSVSIGSLQ